MLPADRQGVLWVGKDPPISSPFVQRRLWVEHLKPDEVEKKLNFARALLITVQPGDFELFESTLRICARAALDRGVMVVGLLASDLDFERAQEIRRTQKLTGLVRLEFATNLTDVAETIARAGSEVGPSSGAVELLGDLSRVSPQSQFLLTRAFHDCASIQVEPLDGGFVAECALRVHAWLRASPVGPRPMPFFVKGGTLQEIAGERQNYSLFADSYIPFNLRPNLIPDRCVAGSERALLVGNFVEDAISLRKALQTGQGSTAIFSLFENTLRGFRMQPFSSGSQPQTGLGAFIKDRCRPEKLSADIAALAASYHLQRSVPKLVDDLVAAAATVSYRSGPYHGDLHAGNVMVRHRDAIVIDFAKTRFAGPLTADPATLEVSLIFDGHAADEDFENWRSFVDQLFISLPSLAPPVPEAKPTNFSWLYRAVRELRHVLVGLEGSEKEAALVLAAYLVRFARLAPNPVSSPPTFADSRHAYALVVAERLLVSLNEQQ
jgi:hypothetical protein